MLFGNLQLEALAKPLFGNSVRIGFSPTSFIQTYSDIGAKATKSSILVLLTLVALSPILRTLTSSTSSDSIWALAACLFLLNAFLTDHREATPGIQQSGRYVPDALKPSSQELNLLLRLSSVISVNAALSASVVLA